MKVHHLGYAVQNIDAAIKSFEAIGYQIEEKTDDTDRNVVIAFARNGETVVELISPLGSGSPVDKILEKNGPTPYHICYEVDSIEDACKLLKSQGWLLLLKPAVAPAIVSGGSARVAFLHNKNIGLIELVETN